MYSSFSKETILLKNNNKIKKNVWVCGGADTGQIQTVLKLQAPHGSLKPCRSVSTWGLVSTRHQATGWAQAVAKSSPRCLVNP